MSPGPRLNIKTVFPGLLISIMKIRWSSDSLHLYRGNPWNGKMPSLYWDGPQVATSHYGDVIMGAIAFQITSLTIVYSTVYSDADQRKHQSSSSLALVRGIHRPAQMASNAENVSIRWRHRDGYNSCTQSTQSNYCNCFKLLQNSTYLRSSQDDYTDLSTIKHTCKEKQNISFFQEISKNSWKILVCFWNDMYILMSLTGGTAQSWACVKSSSPLFG